jgi:hypothetical protein
MNSTRRNEDAERVVRIMRNRYGLKAEQVAGALREVQRSGSRGGLASLGNILYQRGALGPVQASELDRLAQDFLPQPTRSRDWRWRAVREAGRRLEVRWFNS